ncbi:MAG: translation initiation factor IF-2, partial [Chitinophagaceae bacterium]
MAEIKLPRLLAAAKEFNIGQDTLVEFLSGQGFSRDDLKPTAKLTEPMYRSLQEEFQSDKVAKNKADLIEIPKGVQPERKRKDEEEIIFKSTITKEEAKPQAPPETPPEIILEKEPETPAPVEEKVKEEEKIIQPEIVKIEAPSIEGPKAITKIDLSKID